MMFSLSFYIFSAFLSMFDFKKFFVPNILMGSLALMLFVFGLLEGKIYISSIVLSAMILLFFIAILLFDRSQILGGADIKYMMLIGLYLGVEAFFLFLIITGVLQTLALLYKQRIQKRKIAPMLPIMFLAVIITQGLISFGFYTLKL